MKFQICIIYIYIIKVCFSSVKYDFRKYESYTTRNGHAIFDPTEFNIGDTMYFKVTASSFNDERLGYEYLDEIQDGYSFTYDDSKKTAKSYHEVDNEDDNESIRYYKIKKSQDELGNSKGTYLIFYFDCDGKVEIENTEKDEGKRSLILSIVFCIVGIIIIGIIVYFCFCRKKKEDSEDEVKSKENYNINNNQQTNNIEGNSPPQNYVSQNGIYSNQNINNYYNYTPNNNNLNNYNNVNVYNSGINIYSGDNNKNNNNNYNYNYSKYNNMTNNNQSNNINTQYYSNTEKVNVESTKPQNYNQNAIQYNALPMNSNSNL